MKKIIYSDLDGTLFSGNINNPYFSTKNIEAINSWINDGNFFGVATGRNIFSVKRFFKDTNLKVNMPFVLGNGTLVYDFHKDEILYKNVLNKAIIDEAILFYKRHNKHIKLVLSEPEAEYVFADENSSSIDHLDVFDLTITEDKIDYNNIIKLLFIIDPNKMSDYHLEVENFKTRNSFDLFQSGSVYLEILNKGISKKQAIDYTLNHLNFNNFKLYAIGDYNNDLAMVRDSDIGFAPSNAHPDIKKVAKHIVSDSENDAIFDMINILNSFTK